MSKKRIIKPIGRCRLIPMVLLAIFMEIAPLGLSEATVRFISRGRAKVDFLVFLVVYTY